MSHNPLLLPRLFRLVSAEDLVLDEELTVTILSYYRGYSDGSLVRITGAQVRKLVTILSYYRGYSDRDRLIDEGELVEGHNPLLLPRLFRPDRFFYCLS